MYFTAPCTCGHIDSSSSRVAGVAVQLGDREDQLAVAVVLRHRIAAAIVDAARHLAAVELVRRVPAQELLRHVFAPEPQQAFGDHRAVADPGARVGARARLQARAGAADQHVRQRGAQGVDHALALRRAPGCGRDRACRASFAATASCAACGIAMAERHRQSPDSGSDQRRVSRLSPGPGARGTAARRRPARCRPASAVRRRSAGSEMRDAIAGIERRRELPHPGPATPTARGRPSTATRPPSIAQFADRADAADGVEELAGRIHLQRPHRSASV